jgi:hypothetical protein
MTFSSILAVGFYPFLMVLSIIYLYRYTSLKVTFLRHYKSIILFSLAIFIILNFFSIWHLRQESFIYYWDFSGFWRRQLELLNLLKNKPNELFPYVYQSIQFEEYSSFAQLCLLSPMLLVGKSYPRYVLAMLNSGLIPSMILLYCFVITLLNRIAPVTELF